MCTFLVRSLKYTSLISAILIRVLADSRQFRVAYLHIYQQYIRLKLLPAPLNDYLYLLCAHWGYWGNSVCFFRSFLSIIHNRKVTSVTHWLESLYWQTPALTLIESTTLAANSKEALNQTCLCGRQVLSKIYWLTVFWNSQWLPRFAAFFIDARAEISIAEVLRMCLLMILLQVHLRKPCYDFSFL